MWLTRRLLKIKSEDLGRHLNLTFIDKLRVYVRAGRGGNGLKKYGGIGGKGGDIIVRGKQNLTLKNVYEKNLEKRYIGKDGEHSVKRSIFARPGDDLTIEVPLGVEILRDNGELIDEINDLDDRCVVAHGGAGGSFKTFFEGELGESLTINFNLKLLADVGFVGFPNAGKSTLLSMVSRSRPLISSRPFSTTHPQIGTVIFDDGRSFTVADLPGLIEDSHLKMGLGSRFLKHTLRSKVLLFVVDINGFQLDHGSPFRSAFESIVLLDEQLKLYQESLTQKSTFLALNKIDQFESQEKLNEFYSLLESSDRIRRNRFVDIFEISAKNGTNCDVLCSVLRKNLDEISSF